MRLPRLPRLASPVHPIFAHFTIALTSVSLAFDTGAVLFDVASLAAAGWWTLATCAVVTLGTVASGVVSRLRVPMEEGEARRYLRAHMALGPALLGLLLALATWRAALWERQGHVSWPYLLGAVAVVAVAAVQGYLGGELVYRWGAEVRGRYRRLPTEPGRPDDGDDDRAAAAVERGSPTSGPPNPARARSA